MVVASASKCSSRLLISIVSSVHSHPSHHSHAGAPVFVNVEAIDFNISRDRFCQRRKRWMEAKRGRDQVDQRRLVANFLLAEQLCARDMSPPSMSFNSSPVIGALQNVLAIL